MLFLQQASGDNAPAYCLVLAIIILVLFAVGVAKAVREHPKEKAEFERKCNELHERLKGFSVAIRIGKYLAGLPGVSESAYEICCAVLGNDFVFLEHTPVSASVLGLPSQATLGNAKSPSILGTIPRDSINEIIVDDKSQVLQRLTVTRMLAFGVFSLAAPKARKHDTFCLVIDWDDDKGIRQNTIFEFTGKASNAPASAAATFLRQHSMPKGLKPTERKCPYCAEVIKQEAKICRFCRSELPS